MGDDPSSPQFLEDFDGCKLRTQGIFPRLYFPAVAPDPCPKNQKVLVGYDLSSLQFPCHIFERKPLLDLKDLFLPLLIRRGKEKEAIPWRKAMGISRTLTGQGRFEADFSPVSYTHLTLPTTPYV